MPKEEIESLKKELYPIHKHFFIKDEETIPSGYVKYMNKTYDDVLEDTQEATNKARRFLGRMEEIENGQRVIYTQKLPEIPDLPDWLVGRGRKNTPTKDFRLVGYLYFGI